MKSINKHYFIYKKLKLILYTKKKFNDFDLDSYPLLQYPLLFSISSKNFNETHVTKYYFILFEKIDLYLKIFKILDYHERAIIPSHPEGKRNSCACRIWAKVLFSSSAIHNYVCQSCLNR